METAKQIPLVSIDKSLFINHASSPSMSSNEIEYYKDDEIGSGECYMLRYDGKIKPTFINFNDDKYNLQFFKRSMIVLDDKCEELDNSNFNKYI